MYRYDALDQKIVDERVAQFRDQTRRFLTGDLSAEEYQPLRLRNGVYIQRHAPMLRVAIPYGILSSRQLRILAHIARKYDKGYGHFSTRQNIQYNWPKLESIPDILAELATVEMHAIQTSGDCVRNITTDHLAGVAEDEIEDPRPYCELTRQWSTFHPEFSWLPRKFKIAFTGASHDRAALQVHDIGVYVIKNDAGEIGFKILVGGGQGRTPMLGVVIREFLRKQQLLAYLEAIMRVYNMEGRRDNRTKARIKILVKSLGATAFREKVEAEWRRIENPDLLLDQREVERINRFFSQPEYPAAAEHDLGIEQRMVTNRGFARWARRNTATHKIPGYRVVFVSLKARATAPGDATADQMDAVAELADRFSFGEIRVSHDQNLLFTHVRQRDLFVLWSALQEQQLATPNIGTLTDMICCPGLDFCNLANAGSIPIAKQINERFADLDYLHDVGELSIKMSGCMNACGHHHVGNIGILGVDKQGKEFYQFTLGGTVGNDTSLGQRLGPAIPAAEVAETIAKLLDVYTERRVEAERFVDTYRRIGIEPFKQRVYASPQDSEVVAVACY